MEIACGLKRYRLFYCEKKEQLLEAISSIRETKEFVGDSTIRLLGVDAEFTTQKPTLVQLCSGDVVVVVNLLRCDPTEELIKLFSSPQWIKVGNDVEQDFRRLVDAYPEITTRSVFDLWILGRLAPMRRPSLFNMFKSLTGIELSREKSAVLSDYENLTESTIFDAALDAIASYEVGMNFFRVDFSESLRSMSSHDEPTRGTIRYTVKRSSPKRDHHSIKDEIFTLKKVPR